MEHTGVLYKETAKGRYADWSQGEMELRVSRWFVVEWLCLAVLVSGQIPAQTAASWTVRPEWVRAHEEFLASDVLAGRGSATRDEEIAATYVATEFEAYGLQHVPGSDSYLQAAKVVSPSLDGHAVLRASSLQFTEGQDFTLISSSGVSASGGLVLAHVDGRSTKGSTRGAAMMAVGVPNSVTSMQTARMLRRLGAGIVLVPADDSTRGVYTLNGARTETPVRLAGEHGRRGGPNVLVLSASAMAQISRLAEGSTVALTVHEGPEGKTRDTFNTLGFLPGSDPDAGTILLSAHLDHLGVGKGMSGDAVFNGANDDASGTTAVLELAHALAAGPRLRRSVLFVCYGSEELGELGSTYFGEHLPIPLKSLVANLEFEMIGNQDPKMPKATLLLTGWDRSNLGPELKAHGALLGPDPYPEEHFFERSDNYSLALKGVVAHTAAGWGTVPTYHQPNDDLQHLDFPFMTAAIQSFIEPVRWLAASDFVPRWNVGGQPKGR